MCSCTTLSPGRVLIVGLDDREALAQNPNMKVRDVLRLLADDGWILSRTRGSHQQFKHPSKPGLVTVAGSGNDDLAPGTLNSILKQAGLKDHGQE